MLLRTLFIFSFVVWVLLSDAAAQGYVSILPDEIKNPFFEKYNAISKALVDPPANEWVGRYSQDAGETWSELFVWEPTLGFATFRDTCSHGPRAWVNYGPAVFRNGVLFLSPDRDKEDEFVLDLLSAELTAVKWGGEHWLVPSNKLALFAYAVNSRSGDEHGFSYLKIDDYERRRVGRPELPQQYRRLLGLPPVTVRIIEIGEKTVHWYPEMTIDAGKNKGLIEEMSFWLVGHRGINVKVTVTEVRERSSVVRVSSVSRTGDFEKDIIPKLGWRFISRAPASYQP